MHTDQKGSDKHGFVLIRVSVFICVAILLRRRFRVKVLEDYVKSQEGADEGDGNKQSSYQVPWQQFGSAGATTCSCPRR